MSWVLDMCRSGEWRKWATISGILIVIMGMQRGARAAVNLEGQALLSWKKSLNGMGSSLTSLSSWDSGDENPCRWSSVHCSEEGLVTEINLQSMQLSGAVPSQFGSLKSLQSLVMSASNLSGSIPREIGSYSSLVSLDLSANRLTGSIPLEIGRLNRLQNLILNSNQLEGSIPPELGSCNNLVNLIVFDNRLKGTIPPDLGRLSSLEVFRAGGNRGIEGALPAELGNCSSLSILGLAETSVSGAVPSSFGSLKKLKTLAIYTAMLSGPIPAELGNCSELVDLYLYGNSLTGSIPRELGQLHNLERLLLWQNNLVGRIPAELGNCGALMVIDLSINSLYGSIPTTFGNLKNLLELQLSVNNLSGSIPSALVECTGLTQIQLDNNQLSGEIPSELGRLERLTLLFAWQNKLQGGIPSSLGNCYRLESLDLSHNSLTGSIPFTLFQLKNLTKLLLLSNSLTGAISPEIGNCSALVRLRLGDNKLSGAIPKTIGKLDKLNFLDLADNQFSGNIPAEIGGCAQLEMLDLHGNRLSGSLPSTVGLLGSLQVVDISMNELTGSIPKTFGNLVYISKLILNGNRLSGVIPSELGSCTNLQLLDLSSNRLTGGIPPGMGRIQALDIGLNLSWNYLSGALPFQLSSLTKLAYLDLSHNMLSGNLICLAVLDNLVSLNVSFNNFSGSLPNTNFFRELPASDLSGNPGLCTSGEACFTQLSDRAPQARSRDYGEKLVISVLFSATAIMLLLGISLLLIRGRRIGHDRVEDPNSGWPWEMTPFQKLRFSVEDVAECLVDTNIIGKGCSGVVYKAEMPNYREVIAVKKLWPSCSRDPFSAEVKTLGSIRHRNIVRLLGYCSNRTTKLLMYDYMPNGSLGRLLHEKRCTLDWEIRYNILLGAAQGLAYLHHDCLPPILHRDVKTNNILLGSRYEPYLADFGLAKLIDTGDFTACIKSSPSPVAGSYGYIAPEYGYMMKITEKSDVYSYGVVMLEVLTGKQPNDPTIPEGVHLVEWVRWQSQRDAVKVVDPPLLQRLAAAQIQELLQALGVALLCVNSNPDDRPTMKVVAALLKEIRHSAQFDFAKLDLLNPSPASPKGNYDQADTCSDPLMTKSSLFYSFPSPTTKPPVQ